MLDTNADELVKVTVAIGIIGIISAMIIAIIPSLKSIEQFFNSNKNLIENLLGVVGYSILLVIWRKQIAKLILFIKKEIEKLIIVIAF